MTTQSGRYAVRKASAIDLRQYVQNGQIALEDADDLLKVGYSPQQIIDLLNVRLAYEAKFFKS